MSTPTRRVQGMRSAGIAILVRLLPTKRERQFSGHQAAVVKLFGCKNCGTVRMLTPRMTEEEP